MAYEKGKTLEKFSISFKSKKKIFDSYDRVYLLPEINNWISEETTKIWNCNSVVIMIVLSDSDSKYSKEQYKNFLTNESVENTIYLVINSNKILLEDYLNFDEAINNFMDGYVQIFLDTNNKDINEYIDKTPNYSIRIDASQEIIKEN